MKVMAQKALEGTLAQEELTEQQEEPEIFVLHLSETTTATVPLK